MGVRKTAEAQRGHRDRKQKAFEETSFIPTLFLKEDKDTAVIRILSKRIVTADFHEHYDELLGKKFVVYCPRDENHMDAECEYCDEKMKAREKFSVWIHVKYILHRKPDDDGQWEKVKGKKTFYKEEVNKIKLLQYGVGKDYYLYNQFDNNLDEYGTLSDRLYKFMRNGKSGSQKTTYALMNLSPSEMKKSVRKLKAKLPRLLSVVVGDVKRLELDEEDE